MRKVAVIVAMPVMLGVAVCSAVIAFRRNPRLGSTFVNTVVNPRLVERGLAGGAKSEVGTLEHVGRTTGIRRLTPVHPEPTDEGFRILVPLGPNSHWARNVVAAGHCRLQLHETVYELDEPTLFPAGDADSLPTAVRRLMASLGFQYLKLRTFASNPGTLEPVVAESAVADQPAAPEEAAVPDLGEPAVAAAS